jgi:hypothetical protein
VVDDQVVRVLLKSVGCEKIQNDKKEIGGKI